MQGNRISTVCGTKTEGRGAILPELALHASGAADLKSRWHPQQATSRRPDADLQDGRSHRLPGHGCVGVSLVYISMIEIS